MKCFFTILFFLFTTALQAQQGFAFTRFSTEDNTGLSSNVIGSLYQDDRGFIWAGTSNGLQRFDGSKFIQFGLGKADGDVFPYSDISQIIPMDSGQLMLNFTTLHQFGLFDPHDFKYKAVPVKTLHDVLPRAIYALWKDVKGGLYLNITGYGVLRYNKQQNAFLDDHPFPFPEGYIPSASGVYNDSLKQQTWFTCGKGICIYDWRSRQMWYRYNNPQNLPILKNEAIQDLPTEIFIDRQRRIWIFSWPVAGTGGQYKFCLDSTGTHYLTKDTLGLLTRPEGYTEYAHFFETAKSGLWIYGLGVLYNWDKQHQRFHFTQSSKGGSVNSIAYNVVHQVMEDKDGNIWIATDKGLYFTSYGSGTYSIINFLFDDSNAQHDITDITEMPGGEFWFSSWARGVIAFDSLLNPKTIPVYKTPPPANWPQMAKKSVTLTWTVFRQRSTGDVWIGCNYGVLLIYHPLKGTTDYLFPPELETASIRYITEDAYGQVWLGTQRGHLVKWDGKKFTVVQKIGTIIYKVFFDRQGLIWLATHDKGLYCIAPQSGKIVKHYIADGTVNSLYRNTGQDLEQLNDSTIVYGAGALNFINKRTGTVSLLRYEDGLPSNSITRLRMDADGFLWMITDNGLSRYNPYTHRITTYGRNDGVTLAAHTNQADYFSSKGYIMFGGSNAVMMFKTSLFATAYAPADPIITDFKIFNQFIPVDSLLGLPHIKLAAEQNSFSIYFSSLSYQQRDRLTYYYKLEGVDKEWNTAQGMYAQNYSLLPPGDYTFKVYAVNVEGLRSANTTSIRIIIKPHFWRTKWFISTLVFLLLLIVYFFNSQRINRLLAVEKIRNRVARDLHDDMGSTLSTINILSAMAKSKMTTDSVKTAGYLSKISDNSQRMMEAMDDIVWSIKPSNDSMQRVVARMREFATSVLEAKDMQLQFLATDEVMNVRLNMEARRDFFLIFKEALNNAAKYSKAGKVTVEIAVERKQLSFSVTDNGVGFTVAAADGGNGLGNMQKRAETLNGHIKINSKEGGGTTVRLTIPVGMK